MRLNMSSAKWRSFCPGGNEFMCAARHAVKYDLMTIILVISFQIGEKFHFSFKKTGLITVNFFTYPDNCLCVCIISLRWDWCETKREQIVLIKFKYFSNFVIWTGAWADWDQLESSFSTSCCGIIDGIWIYNVKILIHIGGKLFGRITCNCILCDAARLIHLIQLLPNRLVTYVECCGRSRYLGQGRVITSQRYCGI